MKKIPIYGMREFSEGEKIPYFYSNNLRSHLESHKFVNAPHRHSTYIVVLFSKGTGTHTIDFDTYPVKPGSLFLLTPGQAHSWNLSANVDGHVIIHTKEFYDELFIHRKINDFPFFYLQQNYPLILLSSADLKKIENMFGMIHESFRSNSEYKEAKLGALTDVLYIDLAGLYKAPEKKKQPVRSSVMRVRQLQRYIDEHFLVKKFPSEYADLMSMSTRHLNRLCQEVLGKTTGDLIFDRILTEAKRMLIHNELSIAQVAEDLGYEDVSYFIRLFKTKTGISPKEFQSSINLGGNYKI